MPRPLNTKASATRPATDIWTAVAHDLRQPVQAVALLAQVVAAAPNQRGLGQRLQLLSLTMDGMIEAMAEIATLDAGTRAPALRALDVDQVAGALIDKHKEAAAAAGRALRHTPGGGSAHGDPRLLSMVVEGLLLYAIKNASAEEIDMRGRRLARASVLDVEFTGPSPENALHRQAFIDLRPTPAAPTEPVQGLGLLLAEHLARLMGVRIDHVRRRNGRCRLSLRLPLAQT